MSENQYTGVDNLEAMRMARNYNNSILKLIIDTFSLNHLIIDFGCGDGLFSSYLSEIGFQIVGVENDKQLREKNIINGLKVFKSLGEIDFKVKQIFMINVLEHVYEDSKLLKEIANLLDSDGTLLIYVPAHQFLFSKMDSHVGHFRRYNKKQLEVLLSNSGFLVETIQYRDSLGVFASLLYKLLKRNDGILNLKLLIVYDRLIFPISKIIDKLFKFKLGKNLVVIAKKQNI